MPSQKLMTAEELFARSSELGRCELIEGELIKMSPAGYDHGRLAIRFLRYLIPHVIEHDLGDLTQGETGYLIQRDPDIVRAPDIGFVAKQRTAEASGPGYAPVPPDLAIEITSANDAMGEVIAKVQQWLEHGTRAVWVVDPKSRTVTTYHPDGSARVVHLNETLTGGDVLPGFELPLDKLFTD